MSPRPAFDPRNELAAQILDRGPITVSRRDASGGWVTTDERQLAMSVRIDGVERIDVGLVIQGSDTLVAFSECGSCGLWECNLTEGYAASVRRLGPYVLWLTHWDEFYCFDLEQYRSTFGGEVEALPELTEEDVMLYNDPPLSGAYVSPGGGVISFDCERSPGAPLARLRCWPGPLATDLEAVRPPPSAIEVKSATDGAPSLWISETPGPDGRRSAFLPGVVRVPVWLAGPDVERLVAICGA